MQGKIKIGPVGRHDPKSTTMVNWDEGGHNGIISQIFLSHGASGIFSIQFQFLLDDNKFVLSDLHGHNSGYFFDVITLDTPHEYITGISGTLPLRTCFDSPHLKSLKFTTNTKEYGPFGSSNSPAVEKFEFRLGKLFRQLGGFFGTYDVSGLQYIGVYLQPTTVNPKSKPKTGTSNGDEIESKIVLG